MSRPLLSLSEVGFRYRLRKSFFRHEYHDALRSVTFDVFAGETLGVIGRNGCGKSTLLSLLAGIFRPDSGAIHVHDATVALLTLGIGFDPELSGKDNILISSLLLGATRAEADENLEKIVLFSEIGDFIDKPVKTYSSGMRMRLGFSIAIYVQPDVLLIDEVLGVGDQHFRRKAEKEIVGRITSAQTIVLVSHSAEQVKKLCNRAIWLEHGEVKMAGETTRVVDAYEEFLTNEDSQSGSSKKPVSAVAMHPSVSNGYRG